MKTGEEGRPEEEERRMENMTKERERREGEEDKLRPSSFKQQRRRKGTRSVDAKVDNR